jgi:alpha-glucuronidase
MNLEGYKVVDVTPWEAASGGKAVSCGEAKCTGNMRYEGTAGWFTIRVQYFDQLIGSSQFRLLVSGQVVDDWVANDRIPTRKIDGSSSTRRTISGVALRPGDEIRLEGTPDGAEPAAFDYLELIPDRI